jgi:hypothetical protein
MYKKAMLLYSLSKDLKSNIDSHDKDCDSKNTFVQNRDNALHLKRNKMVSQGKGISLQLVSDILNPTSGVHKMLALDPRSVSLWEVMAPEDILDGTHVLHLGDVITSVNVVRMVGTCKSFQIGGEVSAYSSRVQTAQDVPLPITRVISTQSCDKWEDSFVAMDLLQDKGGYILEIEEVYDKNTQILIWILAECFQQVVAQKPATSLQTSSDKFVVCSGFNASTFRTRFRGRFREMALEPLLLGDECPVNWFSHITKMQNYFTTHAEAFQRRVIKVSEMLQTYRITDLTKFKETCDQDHNLRQYMQEFVQHNLCI